MQQLVRSQRSFLLAAVLAALVIAPARVLYAQTRSAGLEVYGVLNVDKLELRVLAEFQNFSPIFFFRIPAVPVALSLLSFPFPIALHNAIPIRAR